MILGMPIKLVYLDSAGLSKKGGIFPMKKIINAPEQYTDDMLKGIYAAHGDAVKHVEGDLR